MKLAVVVQRYGAEIAGGAELHARYIAEQLARHAEVEVVTTCARDYVSWRNELPAGLDRVNGIPVHRFPVRRERDEHRFGRLSRRVFDRRHSVRDELAWLRSEGPVSPAMIRFLRSRREQYDHFIFFSYRYYHAYHGVRAVGPRAVLVPTAERDPAIGLSIFGPIFRGVGAIMYNSLEERALIEAASGNAAVPGVVVGVGSRIAARPDARRFRQRFGIPGRFAIYIGRIDQNKGCRELFEYFQRYAATSRDDLQLVLVGGAFMPVPDHPRIRHLGFVSDEDKFDALAAADFLMMPSYYESLSMVALEAWALGRPVLANGRCDVLRGQCIRSNAGLYYESYDEFAETLRAMTSNRELAASLGRNGRDFFRAHYAWPVIERKYLEMLDRLRRRVPDGPGPAPSIEPLPWWPARLRRGLPPARAVAEGLPSGPVVDARPSGRRRRPIPPARRGGPRRPRRVAP